MISLAIEASTYVGSVALLDDGRVLAERTVAMRGREHEALMPAVAEVMGTGVGTEVTAVPTSVPAIDRVVCGAGPGAFTSLRIAGGIAKGLALSLGVPLASVSSLALVVGSVSRAPGRYLAVVDAMRGEHYAQVFTVADNGHIEAVGAMGLIATADVASAGERSGAVVIGPGQPGERHADPHARGCAMVTNLIELAGPADLATWEPAYGRLAEAQVKWEAANGRPLVAP